LTNIDNENFLNLKNTQVKKKPHESARKTEIEKDGVQNNESHDSSKCFSEIIGRSQVNYTFMNDSFANDIKLFVDNPQSVESTNKFFDLALERYKDTVDAPYEYSTLLAKTYYDMLHGDSDC